MSALGQEELLSIKQVCDILGCHPNTLRNWDKQGYLEAIRIGTRKDRRYKKTEVNKLLNARNSKGDIIHLRTIDLFAGVGGMRIGFENAGFTTVFANDYDQYCKPTYDLNFKHPKLTVGDIAKISSDIIPDFEVLVGGFPCQPFSIAGYRKGFEDNGRGNLFFEILRIIRDKQPPVVFLENVKNLRTHDGGNTYKVIHESLEAHGYHVTSNVLNSMKHGGVPQNRERIFIVAFKSKDHFKKFKFPEELPLKQSFKKLLQKNVDDRFIYNGKSLFKRIKNDIVSEDTVYQWRRQYVRENKAGVCPTLTANMGMGGHNVPIVRQGEIVRKLTPKECSLLQGFPKNYKLPSMADSRLYKQFGNSVTVPLIERIAQNIKIAIT